MERFYPDWETDYLPLLLRRLERRKPEERVKMPRRGLANLLLIFLGLGLLLIPKNALAFEGSLYTEVGGACWIKDVYNPPADFLKTIEVAPMCRREERGFVQTETANGSGSSLKPALETSSAGRQG